MRYMLLIYGSEGSWTEDERTACMIESMGICEELAAQGKYISAAPLHPASTAACVRVRNGERLVTDGPFAETTEQLGGFYLIYAADLDEAIAIAARLPPAKKGTVEVRPVLPVDGLPPDRFSPDGSVAAGDGTPYLLLCYDDEAAWDRAGRAALDAAMAEGVGLAHELDARGRYVSAAPLHPVSTATSVRVRAGRQTVTDGPFAETNEVLGGYYLILAGGRDEAVAVAGRHPGARVGSVEVRRVFDLTPLRESAGRVDPSRRRTITP